MRFQRFAFALLLFGAVATTAEAQTKRAFIVGIGDYEELPDLEKTVGDARGYAQVLEEELGYEVTLLDDNPGRVEFITAFDAFRSSIAPGDDVAFIFSGHGWSDGAENYLVLSDAEQDASEIQLTLDTVGVTRFILENIKSRQPRVTLAIIDACRDYPFASITRSGFEKGLVRTEVSEGTMVMYAAGSNQKALDRLGNDDPSPYSVFTRVLLPKLSEADRPLHDIAREVKTEVRTLAEEIDHDQNPAYYDELLGDFCLSGECRAVEATGQSPDAAAFTQATAMVGTEQGCTALFNYLDDFPDGTHRNVARILLSQPECDFLVKTGDAADPDALASLDFDFEQNFGGRGNDRFDAVAPLPDGGAWLVGYSFDPEIQKQDFKGGGRGPGVYAVRVNAEGRLQASQQVLVGAFISDVVTAPAPDNGVWIAGGFRKSETVADEQLYIMRLDSRGRGIARAYIDSSGSIAKFPDVRLLDRVINRATHAVPTDDGGVLVAGMRIVRVEGSAQSGREKLEAILPLFVRLNARGNIISEVDIIEGVETRIRAMIPDGDGGAFIAGFHKEFADRPDSVGNFVGQINTKGDLGWGLDSKELNMGSVVGLARIEGGLAVLSSVDSGAASAGRVYLLSAYTLEEELLWQQKIAKPGNLMLTALETAADGRLIALGTYSESGAVYSKSDKRPVFNGIAFAFGEKGEIEDDYSFGAGENRIQSIRQGPDGSFWVAGLTDAAASNTGTQDAFVAKLKLD